MHALPTSPAARALILAALLLILSIADLALTAHALDHVPGAVELNPLAERALADGVLAATFYKLVGLETRSSIARVPAWSCSSPRGWTPFR